MNPPIKTQVVIAGAGPTGLSMAEQLHRYNIDFIILEKNKETTYLSKALVIQARTLEIFQELGLAQKAIKQGQITTGMNLYYKGKKIANINLAGLGRDQSSFPFALSLEQSKTEKLLVDDLARKNINVRWNCEVTNFIQSTNGVTVTFKDSEGREQAIDADYLVGCDGASSLVRHQLNLSFEGDTVPKLFYVADVVIDSPVINRNELFMFMIKKGFILFFPMEGEGHYRIVGILPDVEDADRKFEFGDIENSIVKQVISPLAFKKLIWFSTYKVHSRKAGQFSSDQCFIAGDAAHIHTPAGGQGMNTGIQDAYNLAWKIAGSLKHQLKKEILDTYDTERGQNAKNLLRTTDQMFEVMAGTNRFLNFLRLHVFPPILGLVTKSSLVRKMIFPLISQTGISYANSKLTIKSSVGKVKAGLRMPYFKFSDGKEINDFITGPHFKLIYFGDKQNGIVNPGNFKIGITSLSFKEIPRQLFGTSTDFYLLLRPDNHISYAGKDIRTCERLLSSISS